MSRVTENKSADIKNDSRVLGIVTTSTFCSKTKFQLQQLNLFIFPSIAPKECIFSEQYPIALALSAPASDLQATVLFNILFCGLECEPSAHVIIPINLLKIKNNCVQRHSLRNNGLYS